MTCPNRKTLLILAELSHCENLRLFSAFSSRRFNWYPIALAASRFSPAKERCNGGTPMTEQDAGHAGPAQVNIALKYLVACLVLPLTIIALSSTVTTYHLGTTIMFGECE